MHPLLFGNILKIVPFGSFTDMGIKSDEFSETPIIDAAIEDKKTSELVTSHNEESDLPTVTAEEDTSPITSVPETQDDGDCESNLNP